jgi:pilus assembly protein Flp/PilA
MTAKLIRFAKDESGATAVEYAVLAGIALAIALVISQLGGAVNSLYESVGSAFPSK